MTIVLLLSEEVDPVEGFLILSEPSAGSLRAEFTIPAGTDAVGYTVRYKPGLYQTFSSQTDGNVWQVFTAAVDEDEIDLTHAISPGGYTLAVFAQDSGAAWVQLYTESISLVSSDTFSLDKFWRPRAIGNGRLRITGTTATAMSGLLLEWRVTTSDGSTGWIAADLDFTEAGPFGFWIEPPFVQGQNVTVEVRRSTGGGGGATTILSESFVWQWEVHEVEERFLNYYMPDWLRDSDLGEGLYTVHAKAIADLYVHFEDIVFQATPLRATWTMGLWEQMLGLPTIEDLPLTNRRALVMARRSMPEEGARTRVLQSIVTASLGGTPQVVDTYDEYLVTIRLPTVPASVLQAMEEMVQSLKPVGVEINFADIEGFLAGINEAGDPV